MNQFEDLYNCFPLLPLILRQMLILEQSHRFSFKKIKKALPEWAELEAQFRREPELRRDLQGRMFRVKPRMLALQKKENLSKPSSRLTSRVSNHGGYLTENSNRDHAQLSNFSNYVTTSSKYISGRERGSRRESRRESWRPNSPINGRGNNPLQINVTPEKLRGTDNNNYYVKVLILIL
jgi:hypothetical protein